MLFIFQFILSKKASMCKITVTFCVERNMCARVLIFLNILLTPRSALKSMKGERISSDIRNVRAHDLRSNDLRTKNIIILRAS